MTLDKVDFVVYVSPKRDEHRLYVANGVEIARGNMWHIGDPFVDAEIVLQKLGIPCTYSKKVWDRPDPHKEPS